MERQVQEVIHWPRLDTVLMVEDAIKKSGKYNTRAQLWKSLPKKMMYQTFILILEYLARTRRIHLTKDGRIVWIGGNAKLDNAIAKGIKVRMKKL